MSKRNRSLVVTVASTAAVAAVAIFGWTYSASKQHAALRSSEISSTQPNVIACINCGPRALFIALGRLGIPATEGALTQELKPQADGTPFSSMLAAARGRGFDATLQQVTWASLAAFDGVAVLWVGGNHYLTVDPRESTELRRTDGLLRVYDSDKPAQWWSRSQLAEIWKGEALLIPRARTAADTGVVQWESCLQDLGALDSKEPAVFKFRFRNVGKSALPVKVIQVGCSCSTPALSRPSVPPGEQGEASVEVNLKAKRGFFQSYVVLAVGEDQTPVVLNMQGAVKNETATSVEKLYLGEVMRGRRASRSFFVYGINDSKLAVGAVTVLLDGGIAETLQPKIHSAELTAAEIPGGERERNRLHLTPGDYRIDLDVAPSATAPLGRVDGTVRVESNLSAGPIEVPFEANIISSLQVTPAALMVSLVSQPAPAQLRLTRADEGAIEIEKVSFTGSEVKLSGSPKISKEANHVLLETLVTLADPKARQGSGELVVRLVDGNVVQVPLVVVRAP